VFRKCRGLLRRLSHLKEESRTKDSVSNVIAILGNVTMCVRKTKIGEISDVRNDQVNE
jgi:hypothetical protein